MSENNTLNKFKVKDIGEFTKLFKVPFPIHEHADYYVDTLSKSDEFSGLRDQLTRFVRYEKWAEDSRYKSLQSYKLDYAMPMLVDYIKDTKAYERLQDWETPDDINYHKLDRWGAEENDGAMFLSIDFRSANFNALKLFDTKADNELGANWEELCNRFEIHPMLIESKSFRQMVFGNTNPKRLGKVQHTYIMKLWHKLETDDIAFLSEDEIVIRLGDLQKPGLADEVSEYLSLIDSPMPIHTNIYKLDKIGKGKYVKTLYYMTELSADGLVLMDLHKTLFGVPGNMFYKLFKEHILKEPIDERDLLFMNDKKAAKWVMTEEHEYLAPMTVDDGEYLTFPYKLKAAVPTLSRSEIEKIIEVFGSSCKYCLDGDNSCRCWDDS